MVIAYNPNSKYASEFKAYADGSKPLSTLFSDLLQTPGLKLGRTDPNTDPQGRDFIYMLELAQKYYNLPSDTVSKILGTTDFGTSSSARSTPSPRSTRRCSPVSSTRRARSSRRRGARPRLHPAPRRDQPRRRRARVDLQTASVKIKTGTKTGSPQDIDITTIGTPTPAAEAFVAYTLSPAGLAQYKQGGFTVLTPTLFGTKSDVPAPVASELP